MPGMQPGQLGCDGPPVAKPRWRRDMPRQRDLVEETLAKFEDMGFQLDSIGNILNGTEYLGCLYNGEIKVDDICVMFSIDGAQIYRNKLSDLWLYI